MSNPAALWAAVDTITEPTHVKLDRDTVAVDQALETLDVELRQIRAQRQTALWSLDARTATSTELAQLRRIVSTTNARARTIARTADALRLAHGVTPSLWQQVEDAIEANTTGADGAKKPKRELAVVDLELVEQHDAVRTAVRQALADLELVPRTTTPAALRQLVRALLDASWGDPLDPLTGAHRDAAIGAWTRLIRTWHDDLERHLRLTGRQPVATRLRGVACPTCLHDQVLIDAPDNTQTTTWPVVVHFAATGTVAYAQCDICGDWWPRGNDLLQLADQAVAANTRTAVQQRLLGVGREHGPTCRARCSHDTCARIRTARKPPAKAGLRTKVIHPTQAHHAEAQRYRR